MGQHNQKGSPHTQDEADEEGGSGASSREYRPEYAPQAETLCQLGFDEDELASFFIVDRRTIEDWKYSRPEFGAAVESGKCAVDGAVQVTTLRRILGYYYYVPVVFRGKKIYLKKYAHPDPDAAFKWLAARRPEEWGER